LSPADALDEPDSEADLDEELLPEDVVPEDVDPEVFVAEDEFWFVEVADCVFDVVPAGVVGLCESSVVGLGVGLGVGLADGDGDDDGEGDVLGEVEPDGDGDEELLGFGEPPVGGFVDLLGDGLTGVFVALGDGDLTGSSGSGAPRSGVSVSPSMEPKMRVAANRRVHRTGASRTFRPLRGASTIMPSPAYIATW
jgi:hypothetical protein